MGTLVKKALYTIKNKQYDSKDKEGAKAHQQTVR